MFPLTPDMLEVIQGMFIPVTNTDRLQHRRIPYPVPFNFPLLPQMNSFPHIGAEGHPQMRKLFIGGLSHDTNDEALRSYFSQWGPVVDAIVIREPNTKQSRGFGFVTFATIASAENAMMDKPHILGGKAVDSKRAIPREQMTPNFPPSFFNCEPLPGCKLMLSGVHWDYHSVETLRRYFESFGALEQIEVLGNPRGLGFVIFENRNGADKCLSHNNGRHMINERRVDVRPFPIQNYWRRPRTATTEEAKQTVEQGQLSYDEESNYGGTTTEDECKSSENDDSTAASDTDSLTNAMTTMAV
ncbi:unnamed protein product [Auanema sp. JU1783]|nr:unnamed protein product [Auanema sp. JU1783]